MDARWMGKKFWLVKQEPEAYGWETFVKEGEALRGQAFAITRRGIIFEGRRRADIVFDSGLIVDQARTWWASQKWSEKLIRQNNFC